MRSSSRKEFAMRRPRRTNAGSSAKRHFDAIYKPWRRGFRRRFALLTIGMLATATAVSVLFPRYAALYWVATAALLWATYDSMVDSPPEWIDNWRRGAEGERKTARRLKRLSVD